MDPTTTSVVAMMAAVGVECASLGGKWKGGQVVVFFEALTKPGGLDASRLGWGLGWG